MNRIALFLACLTIFALCKSSYGWGTPCCPSDDCPEVVCQPCQNATVCPECFPDGATNNTFGYERSCCQQRTAVLALTAAAIEASVTAWASTQACAFAATKAIVGAVAASTAGAFVSICASYAVGLPTQQGGCCSIESSIRANASAYADACSQAVAEATASANATATASAIATSAAYAASALWGQAETLIQSSCCGFDLGAYQLVLIAGEFAVNASMGADISRTISTSVSDTARVCKDALVNVKKCSSSVASNSTDNCCVNKYLSSTANSAGAQCQSICRSASELHRIVSIALDGVAAYGIDNNTLAFAQTNIDETCSSECSDFPTSCCNNLPNDPNCCVDNTQTLCQASQAIVDVVLSASAIAETYVEAAVYTKARAKVYAAAIANASAIAYAATNASLGIGIQLIGCCTINVTMSYNASAVGAALSSAFSAAEAAANASAVGAAYAFAISAALAHGHAETTALSTYWSSGCCGTPCCNQSSWIYATQTTNYTCCDVTYNVVTATSPKFGLLAINASSEVYNLVKSKSIAVTSAKAQDCVKLIRRVNAKISFALQCCCCTTKAATTTTATIKFGTTITSGVKTSTCATGKCPVPGGVLIG